MFNTKSYSGFTGDAPEHIVIDSGAIFKNFDYETDDYDSALLAGKLLGTTQGGATINIVAETRQPQLDGVKSDAKGVIYINKWNVNLQSNIVTLTSEALKAALIAADLVSDDFYDKITGRNTIKEEDYLDNLTLVGKVAGAQKPIIFQLFNALNIAGIVASLVDSAESVIPVDFRAHVDLSTPETRDTPPFALYRPKAEGTISGSVTDGGTPVAGATVTVTIGTEDFTATTSATGTFIITAIPYNAGLTVTATKDALTGSVTDIEVTGGNDTAVGAIAIA